MPDRLWDELAAIVGKANVRTDEASRAQASSSWYPAFAKQKQANEGRPPRLVSAVVTPADARQISEIVRWANDTRTPLIPVGGASNTVGSTQPETQNAVAVDLLRLQNLTWDENSLLVTAGAGWSIAALEERLGAHGHTLGHFPYSMNLATVGGSIATNAVGLLSGRYGRMSDLTVALEAVLPTGEIWRSTEAPAGANSAGPDLMPLFFGSEGALGIFTEATLKIRPIPDVRAWAAFTFDSMAAGIDALRLLYHTDARPACVRLLDTAAAQKWHPGGNPLLLLMFEGDELVQTGAYQMAHAVCAKAGGKEQSPDIGEEWFAARGETSWYGPNGRRGGVADALAVSARWSDIERVHAKVGETVGPMVTRLEMQVSHAGPSGAALEIVFDAQAQEPATPESALMLYERIVATALGAVRSMGGRISHHFGVGPHRIGYYAEERGEAEMRMLRVIKTGLDPRNIMNPGKRDRHSWR